VGHKIKRRERRKNNMEKVKSLRERKKSKHSERLKKSGRVTLSQNQKAKS